MSPTPQETLGAQANRAWRSYHDHRNLAAAAPTGPKPWYGHIDERVGLANFTGFEGLLKGAMASPPSGPVGTFMHGYSGSSTPSSFQTSAVKDAPSLGVGAMLNIKNNGDWGGAMNGAYDSQWANVFETWPVGTFGEVTWEHEPENNMDASLGGQSPSNPNWVSWANTNAPKWRAGLVRFISVAAPIIRRRGLDVKVGGCLMDFSWDTTRWQWWQWWDQVAPADIGQVAFQADVYAKTDNPTSGPKVHDLMPRVNTMLAEARSVGIGSMSFWETALDRRLRNGGNTLVGTEASTTAGWDAYYKGLQTIPEMRMICYYHTPGGPASDQAFLTGASITKYADICMQGRRP